MTTSSTNHPSTLALLRDLVPLRPVAFSEALRVAELQAARLREHLQIDGPMLPSEIVNLLPRITIEFDPDLPASGSAFWNGSTWVITLNATESKQRQRFSLFHELKHVIDHTTKGLLYGTDNDADQRAERAADYFAACLLMPKRWVKRLWGEGTQRPTELAEAFAVSAHAMTYRINQLGLTDTYQRCHRPRTYRRALPMPAIGVAT